MVFCFFQFFYLFVLCILTFKSKYLILNIIKVIDMFTQSNSFLKLHLKKNKPPVSCSLIPQIAAS